MQGSLYRELIETPKLHGWIINRDPNGVIGQNISAAVEAISNSPSRSHITWDPIPANMYTDAQIDNEIAVQESSWAALIIETDATARLTQARNTGDASFNPMSLLTLVYSESRNQQAVPGIIVSGITNQLQPTLASISATLAAQYISQNIGNQAALQNVVNAPRTISNSIVIANRNLRPYDANKYNGAILAATYVGLIYLTILAFNIVMGNLGMRQAIQRRLKLSSLIGMRILVPIAIYFWLSLMFTLLQAAFHLDFDGWGLGYGAGFMTFWMVAWSSMSALGLTLECILSLVGPQFIAFGLVVVIIINVSGALIPLELSPSFYLYNRAMVFYNTKQCFLTIFTNAGRHLVILKAVGIIWAWVAVMVLTFPIWIWLERRRQLKEAKSAGGPQGSGKQADEKETPSESNQS